MARAQVFRMEKRASVGGNLGRHIDGQSRPKEADQRDGMAAVELLDADGRVLKPEDAAKRRSGAAEYLERCRKVRSRGPKPKACLEFVVSGLTWDDPVQHHRDFIAAAAKHVLKCGGPGMRIAHLALHLDETEPHGHILVVCADGGGRLGWNRVRSGFGMSGVESGRALMGAMQDRFHADVGDRFGLERGKRGSTATHQPIDRAAGVKTRLEEERRRGVADGEALALAAAKEEKKKRDAAVKKLRADLTKVQGELVRAQTVNLHLKDLRDCMLDDIGYNKVGQNWAVNEFRARGVELEFSDDGKWTEKDVPAAATPVRSGRAASKPVIGRARSRP